MRKFELTDQEEKAAEEWLKNHDCGPIFLKDQHQVTYNSYIFTPTPIGYGVDIKCGKCGKTHDITDYSTW